MMCMVQMYRLTSSCQSALDNSPLLGLDQMQMTTLEFKETQHLSQ